MKMGNGCVDDDDNDWEIGARDIQQCNIEYQFQTIQIQTQQTYKIYARDFGLSAVFSPFREGDFHFILVFGIFHGWRKCQRETALPWEKLMHEHVASAWICARKLWSSEGTKTTYALNGDREMFHISWTTEHICGLQAEQCEIFGVRWGENSMFNLLYYFFHFQIFRLPRLLCGSICRLYLPCWIHSVHLMSQESDTFFLQKFPLDRLNKLLSSSCHFLIQFIRNGNKTNRFPATRWQRHSSYDSWAAPTVLNGGTFSMQTKPFRFNDVKAIFLAFVGIVCSQRLIYDMCNYLLFDFIRTRWPNDDGSLSEILERLASRRATTFQWRCWQAVGPCDNKTNLHIASDSIWWKDLKCI